MAEQKSTRHSCKFIDLTGQRFGRLVAVTRAANRNGKVYWDCACDCGNSTTVNGRFLRESLQKSCGCINAEKSLHGMRNTHEYRAWKHAKSRCYNPNVDMYPRYGGRGITMCDEWRESFHAFFADMGRCPDGLTLNRIDNDGPYAPWNCEWASNRVQCTNRRTNVRVTHNGKTQTAMEWSEELGISYSMLRRRLKEGDPNPFAPPHPRKKLT